MSNSLFESFNARSLEPGQVGEGFIFSPVFRDVIERSNTAIIGPRGSGKTTLLKMLTLPALSGWRDPRAKDISVTIDYVAVYVPADFTWYPDFRRPIKAKSQKDVDDLLSYALFRSHVLLALCDTIEYMIEVANSPKKWLHRFALPQNAAKLDELIERLAQNWDVRLRSGGIQGLKEGIANYVKRVQYLLTITSLKTMQPIDLIEAEPSIVNSFLDDLKAFANVCDHVFRRQYKWAICFDEVEIAPDNVKEQIWRSSRSFDQRFLIKFSASPYDDHLERIFGPKMAMEGHDYRPVYLQDQKTSDLKKFSQQLFNAICGDFGVPPTRADAMLGSSSFGDEQDSPKKTTPEKLWEESSSRASSPYEKGGVHFRRFSSLAKKDPDFKAYLERKNIDMDAFHLLPERTRAAEIRKLITTVAVRDEFLFEQKTTSIIRTERKRRYRAKKSVPDLYTGAASLFLICEANPRWLIGLLRPLIKTVSEGGSTNRLGVDTVEQAKRLEKVVTSFLALLSTIHVEDSGPAGTSIVDTIDDIGEFFSKEVVGIKFRPEPILSFVVDKRVQSHIRKAVGRGLNQGAFVLLPERDKAVQAGSIDGRRLRLTHLLAPIYRLPLVLGRSIELSTLLTGTVVPETQNALLLDLFAGLNDD